MTATLVIDVGTTACERPSSTTPADHGARAPRRVPPSTPFAGPRRVRRHACWPTSSSMRRATVDRPQWRAGRRRRHHEPAGLHDSCGTLDRRPIGPASGGRTCAPSASADGQGRARPGTGTEPVGDQGGLAARQLSRRSPSGPLHRHRRLVDRLDAVRGVVHVTDHTNAPSPACSPPTARRGRAGARRSASRRRCSRRSSTSCGVLGAATPSTGAPPIAGLVGDQQASLIGQGCVVPGRAKITFGTGGMLDLSAGRSPPASPPRPTAPSRSSPGLTAVR